MAVGVLLQVAALARCGRAAALGALLMFLWLDLGASAPTNCPPEVASSLGEAALAIVVFFSAVEFSKAACAAIEEAGLSLKTVQACWEASDDSGGFSALMAECCPKLPVAVRIGMAAVFKRAERAEVTAVSGARARAASGGPVSFGPVLATELAVGLEAAREGGELNEDKIKELSAQATEAAVKRCSSQEVVNTALFEATMYPIAVLNVAKEDPVMFDKLRSKLIKDGCGEYKRHMSTLAGFDEWLASIYTWLNLQGVLAAATVLQKWRLSIVLDWAMGGKEYVRLYFNQYHGTFPVECDAQLMFRAQAAGVEKFMKKLDKLNVKKVANAASASDSE
jgi:hypothetical protein